MVVFGAVPWLKYAAHEVKILRYLLSYLGLD